VLLLVTPAMFLFKDPDPERRRGWDLVLSFFDDNDDRTWPGGPPRV